MKKNLILTILFLRLSTFMTAQVGINPTGAAPHPNAMLDIQSTNKGFLIPRMTTAERISLPTPVPANGLMVFDTNTQSLWQIQTGLWVNLATPTGANLWSGDPFRVFTTSNNRNVNIGSTANNLYKLNVTHNGNEGVNIKSNAGTASLEIDGVNRYREVILSKPAGELFSIGGNNNDFSIFNFQFLNTLKLPFRINHLTNNVGIGLPESATINNKLTIGAENTQAGHVLAISNGAQEMSIDLSATNTAFYTNTNFALMPAGNGTGYLGIGTLNPLAPLHIVRSNILTSRTTPDGNGPSESYFDHSSTTAVSLDPANLSPRNLPTSIYAEKDILTHSNVMAFYSVVASDNRLKNIIGLSNNEADLKTIQKIKIKNYLLKDSINYGNQKFKKVIAQQVEELMPNAVNTTSGVVPDIYCMAQFVEYNGLKKELSVLLGKNYGIKTNEQLQLVHPEKGKILAKVSHVNGNKIIFKNWLYPTDKIFVMGRLVNDFKSVDYQQLAMLNISAIQALSKTNETLKQKLEKYEQLLRQLEEKTSSKLILNKEFNLTKNEK